MKPDDQSERQSITIVEVAAYLVLALCLVFAIDIILAWAGRQLGTDIMEVGRRHDLGFLLSLGLGLFLTHKIAAKAGFRPRKKQ